MTSWVACPATGPTGFDLDVAVLVSPDVVDREGGRWTSRATGTPWRESLWRTGSGEHVVGLDSGGAGSSGLDADHWRWVSAVLAEDWLRSQGLHEMAELAFPDPGPEPVTVVLDHRHRARLEQVCADDDVSVDHVLGLALGLYLRSRSVPPVLPWWPAGVTRDVRPGWDGTEHPGGRAVPAQTLEP